MSLVTKKPNRLSALALCLVCTFGAWASPAAAQTAPAVSTLAKELSGRWTYTLPSNGQILGNRFSMQLTAEGEKVTGKLTWYGINCGASDEPLTGSFTDGSLKITSALKANVSTQRPYGNCEPNEFHIQAKLGEDGKTFEGKAWQMSNPATRVDVKFSP